MFTFGCWYWLNIYAKCLMFMPSVQSQTGVIVPWHWFPCGTDGGDRRYHRLALRQHHHHQNQKCNRNCCKLKKLVHSAPYTVDTKTYWHWSILFGSPPIITLHYINIANSWYLDCWQDHHFCRCQVWFMKTSCSPLGNAALYSATGYSEFVQTFTTFLMFYPMTRVMILWRADL